MFQPNHRQAAISGKLHWPFAAAAGTITLVTLPSVSVSLLEKIMNRLLVAAVLAIGLQPGLCTAVEISNIRARYGPYGAVRPTDLKCLPKDVIVITYDISGLTVDPKSGKANYTTTLELIDEKDKDGKAKVLFKKDTDNEPVLQLGGGKMPGDLFVQVGEKQTPGKYIIRLKLVDKLDKNKGNGKSFDYPYEVLPEKFGMVGVSAPAIVAPGVPYAAEFFLVNFMLDKKGDPKGEVVIRVLDEKGKEVDSVKHVLPIDLPAGANLANANIVPFRHPIYPNRPGRFTVEITAEDRLGKSKVQLSYPFTVIDINALGK